MEPSANEKEYEPKDFESTHINDVVQENEELKMKVIQPKIHDIIISKYQVFGTLYSTLTHKAPPIICSR